MLKTLNLHPSVPAEVKTFLQDHYTLDAAAEWSLQLVEGNLQLLNPSEQLALCLDFMAGAYPYRASHTSKEPLLQAVKIKGHLPKHIIDATPGCLRDGLLLASRGITVTAIERSPLMYYLLDHALQKARNQISSDTHFNNRSTDSISNQLHHFANICLIFADAIDWLGEAQMGKAPLDETSTIQMERTGMDEAKMLKAPPAELIYLDPIFPQRQQSALAKKEMRIVKACVGEDLDADQLLVTACATGIRVVVKRPEAAPPLADAKPDYHSQMGKTRFDVYLPRLPRT